MLQQHVHKLTVYMYIVAMGIDVHTSMINSRMAVRHIILSNYMHGGGGGGVETRLGILPRVNMQ